MTPKVKLDRYSVRQKIIHTLMHKFPGQIICWILPGTSIDLNFAGRSGALWGTCKSPRAKTSTIVTNQYLKAWLGNLMKQSIRYILINSNDEESGNCSHQKKRIWKLTSENCTTHYAKSIENQI